MSLSSTTSLKQINILYAPTSQLIR